MRQDLGGERRQVLDPIAGSDQRQDRQRQFADALLELKIPVHGDERAEMRRGDLQERAVCKGVPLHEGRRAHVVPNEEPPELPGDAMIEEDSHAARAPPLFRSISRAETSSTPVTISRGTPSNASMNCSTVSPSLRYSK